MSSGECGHQSRRRGRIAPSPKLRAVGDPRQGEQPVDALALGIAADLVVILGAGVADLAHIAENQQNFAADGRRQTSIPASTESGLAL